MWNKVAKENSPGIDDRGLLEMSSVLLKLFILRKCVFLLLMQSPFIKLATKREKACVQVSFALAFAFAEGRVGEEATESA